MTASRAVDATRIVVLAGVYLLAAKLGFRMATVTEQVTLVWPPTGIALAALILYGRRLWPGVAVGAFLANATTDESVWTAFAIAAGNTAEAVVGAWLLDRLVGFEPSLPRLKDVLGLICFAALASTTIAATVGATSLCLSEKSCPSFGTIWTTWWLGDASGALIVAPILLVGSRVRRERPTLRTLAEAGGVFTCVVAVGVLTSLEDSSTTAGATIKYLAFPLLTWTALRFAQQGATAFVFAVAVAATFGTVAGRGTFAGSSPHQSLLHLQLFLGVVAVTGLVLGAATATRRRAEDRLRADYQVGRILVAHDTLEAAAPRLLGSIGETLGWQVGALWRVDDAAGVLRCVVVWHTDANPVPDFESDTRQRTFAPGVGLPGRVWAGTAPLWIADVVRDPNFQRKDVVAKEGLHAAFAFPFVSDGRVAGVVEFFSGDIRGPDSELLEMVGAVGSQIGQLVERESGRRALSASEERFHVLAESIPSIVWTADERGNVQYTNRRWPEYCGISEVQSPRDWAQLVVHPDDQERRAAVWARALASGEPFEMELRNRRHDGAYRWFMTRAVPRRDADGRVVSWFGVTTDIHDHKTTEEKLQEADRHKDEFLATLSHELRNPLAPLANALHLLRNAESDSVNAVQRDETLDLAQRQLQYMVRLVDDLLDVSRLTRGEIALRLERIRLKDVIERAVETSRPLIEARGHSLTLDVADPAVEIDADPTRVAQVLANLLNNSAKYTDRGGRINVSVSVAPATTTAPAAAMVRVADTGIGIPAEALPRVFEPFMQVHRSLEGSRGGLGIGLTLVKRLVEAHGGTVAAQSAGPGKGTEVVVRLPLAPPSTRAAGTKGSEGPRVEGAAPVPRRRVLVVDDNRDSAKTMGMVLRKMGNEVALAYDGPEAVQRAEAFAPQVVLLDIGLPQMSGYEVAERIRAQPGGRSVTLIAMTGWGQEEDRRRTKAAGFDHHLVKPVDHAALRRLLAQVGQDGPRPEARE